jgi:cell division transport system permease protein
VKPPLPKIKAIAGVGSASNLHNNSPIVPSASISGKALVAVIAIMSFLACLTAGAVYMLNRSANAWLNDIASEITVQVATSSTENIEQKLTSVAMFIARQKGVSRVQPFSFAETMALLEPWLGKNTNTLSQLPVPRLIAVEINRHSPPDIPQLRRAIESRFANVTLDDHRHWRAQIKAVTRSLAIGGMAVLVLVAIATAAIIISATRSSMASNREIIEVLHLVGATQRFIVREFDHHFMRLGIKAGVLGALLASIVFLLLPFFIDAMGHNTATAIEVRQLIGAPRLDIFGYFILVFVVVGVAAICMFTSRYWVDHILNFQHQQRIKNSSPNTVFGLFSDRNEDTVLVRAPVSNGKSVSWRMFGKRIKMFTRAIIAVMLLVIGGFILFVNSIDKEQQQKVEQADGIVVLTGGTLRIANAIQLLADKKAPRMLITGVYEKTRRSDIIRQVPAAGELFKCCIDLDYRALNTIDNAIEAKRWVELHAVKSLIVVTSSYHMPRAMLELRRRMPENRLIAYPVVSEGLELGKWWSKLSTIRLLASEYLKYISALARFVMA